MYQIEKLTNPLLIKAEYKWPRNFLIIKSSFLNTKIVCLKTLHTIKQNIIKNNKILSEP